MNSNILAAWGTSSGGPGDWRDQSACRAYDAEQFFPVGNSGSAARQTEQAIAVCLSCPVRVQCLKYALDNRIVDGVWGGMAEGERLSLKRRTDRIRRDAERAAPKPPPVEALPATARVLAEDTRYVIGVLRDAGKSWREIGHRLNTSDSTCREVHAGTRPTVARATEETARKLSQSLVNAE